MDLQRIEFLMYQLGRAVGALRASHDNACNMVGLEIEEAIKERTTPNYVYDKITGESFLAE